MTDDKQPEPANECWPWELEMEEYERQLHMQMDIEFDPSGGDSRFDETRTGT
jgi:hypothetical protein